MDIPNLTFLPDGSYDLSTLEKRLAAAECLLGIIAAVPVVYVLRGPEFCRDAMATSASDLARRLKEARTPLTPELVTEKMLRDLLTETGGVWVAGQESCSLALGERLEAAKAQGDEAYYAARADQDESLQHCCDVLNARRGAKP